MKVALYIGSHTKDTPGVRLGWWLTRLAQEGNYAQVTHCESILEEHENGEVTIGSASLRDGGVRTKRCSLTAGNWLIVDVPSWKATKAKAWFKEHAGQPYDWRGALASAFPFQWAQKGRWFCNQSVAAPFMESPEILGPSELAAVLMSFGKNVTKEFFDERTRA